ncbi:trimeric intracellular cation channel family protein [Acidiphilium sp. AL]|uniref:trimeric intracellular cation channel family protein n=1 Tax=Acidiphilium sp. AL TaxID=2871704 RepID=UPI0021CB22F0|nr:trimeric intracellular cation channel family protein [Acidiphilium sp. AL]MCU4159685.1 trimeric intracellular cation channel family protein [Acidiphilium sp. AL]
MNHVLAATLLVRALNLIGTFVFALSGAVLGARREMDLFGVLVLAFVTAVSGGIMRDVLIGAIPPEAFSSWHTLAIALIAGLLGFVLYDRLEILRNPVQIFDAAGLGIFAVAGTQKALEYGLNPPMAAILGMVSGIGGGMARDVLTAQVPIVLRTDIYALAALAAALVVIAGHAFGLPSALTDLPGVALCLFLRLMALYGGWRLPSAHRKR